MGAAIVTTTINVPRLLDAYAVNAIDHGHDDVLFVVIGDRRTPPEARAFCEELERRGRLSVRFLGIDDQLEYLAAEPALRDHLPFDSVMRRNIGMLLAYRAGADPIITIDDDNFIHEGDFLGEHAAAGARARWLTRRSSTGWYNVCDALIEERGFPFYHRGYPMAQRWPVAEALEDHELDARVVVNAGLWLEDPDVDASARLTHPIRAVGYRGPRRIALEPGTWSPFNSQNTALARDVVPAYFLSPLIGRYDDIWASYIVARIAEHRGELIAFGAPLVRQERNAHDVWNDLDRERDGMRLTDLLCGWLRETTLVGMTYRDCLPEIEVSLRARLAASELGEHDRRFVDGFLRGLRVWAALFGE